MNPEEHENDDDVPAVIMPDPPENHTWEVAFDPPTLEVRLCHSITGLTAASISTQIPEVEGHTELAMYVASVASQVLEKYRLAQDAGDLLQVPITAR